MKRVVDTIFGYMRDVILRPKKRTRTDNSEAQESTTTIIAKTNSHTAQKLPTIEGLPDELLKHIFLTYIGDGSYDMIAPVSKHFKEVYEQCFPAKVTYIKNAAASVSLAQMFLQEMMCDTKAIGEAYHKLILHSIKLGNMTVLQWAIRNEEKYLHGRNLVIHENMLRSNVYPDVAAETGNVDMLKYLKSLGCVFTAKTMKDAVSSDNLECVKYLRSVDCPWNKYSSYEVVDGHSLELVRYLLESEMHVKVVGT
ncbi:hypothetical protein CTEN210_13615 [Chaetoceros tenuissimus]|uniref:Uncharacterized protein n=1 Tax=Chaetoceros tenuissimus TaxID=426638 RepID=A0AAD3HBK2_9STRA|nr:hypothetical protein CTEN210_13615 [Chaetoceros tenuissimus]